MSKFNAFISYSHQDIKWAKLIQRKIEDFKFPKTKDQRYPDSLLVCRDLTDFSANNLTAEIEEKLTKSEYLIVVCSQNIIDSTYVEQEIEFFIKLGREKNIILCFICKKEDEKACMPKSLSSQEYIRLNFKKTPEGINSELVSIIARIAGADVVDLRGRTKKRK